MVDVGPPRLRQRTAEEHAEIGFGAVQRDPALARQIFRDVLDDPTASKRARMLTLWGQGRLCHDANEVVGAHAAYVEAIVLAAELDLPHEEAQLRVSWSLSLQAAGDAEAALRQLDLAAPHLSGAALGRLVMQRGYIDMFRGRTEAASQQYDAALPLLRRAGDRLGMTRLLCNRGIARIQLGRMTAARADFEDARRLAEELDQGLLLAGALHNLAYLDGRLNRVPEALASLAAARARYERLGSPGRMMAALDTDWCEILLDAGLAVEACTVADRLLSSVLPTGDTLALGDAHFLHARALLMSGQRQRAREEAEAAEAAFRATGRTPSVALARYVGVLAEVQLVEGGEATLRQLARLRHVARRLDAAGWRTQSTEVRVLAGRLALALGRHDVARAELALAARARMRGTPATRADAWHAEALLHLAAGDTARARRSIRSGLRVIDRHRATLGAAELRARVSAHGVALAQLGLTLALRRGRAAEVLVWAERWRAGALVGQLGPVEPDDEMTNSLAELRRLHGVLQAVTLDPDAADGRAATESAIDELERAVTRRTRMLPGDPRALGSTTDLGALRAACGDHILVEYVEHGDDLYAVVVERARMRLVRLGAASSVSAANDHLLFAIRRLGLMPGRPGNLQAMLGAGSELAQLLVAPLGLRDNKPLVIVPTGRLHGIPWGALPDVRNQRSFVVAPSAAWWLSEPPAESSGRRVLLVEGPDLPHAAEEIAALAGMYTAADRLSGAEATVQQVLDELVSADLVHIAAHGVFRTDSPLFSSLRMADGPLVVHDLQWLRSTPATIVLTACSAGRTGVLAGDEVLGTTTALLSLGVRTVIAPLLPVPDRATARFATDLHAALVTGSSPPAAVALATAKALQRGDDESVAAAVSFQCIATRSARFPVSAARRATL